MTYKEFIEKYHLNQMSEEDEAASDLLSFLYGMDFIYGNFTREQALVLMGDFYDNADDIYNSLSEAIVTAAVELARAKKEAQAAEETDSKEKIYQA